MPRLSRLLQTQECCKWIRWRRSETTGQVNEFQGEIILRLEVKHLNWFCHLTHSDSKFFSPASFPKSKNQLFSSSSKHRNNFHFNVNIGIVLSFGLLLLTCSYISKIDMMVCTFEKRSKRKIVLLIVCADGIWNVQK